MHSFRTRAFGVAILSCIVASVTGAADTLSAKYRPVFEVELAATPGTIGAAYLRAYHSDTPEVAVKRWEDFLKKHAGDSIDDFTEVTLLRPWN